ncbi:MAG: TetM/TetW/TetO/TetS family tetracycline resistance ribosomal protection protein [Actinomycetota bacterium]|nr:TetM/TetW/TetO/TetS family tetracycline resistance ribosomal protection protein [Actinomycetota bacterium]
MSSSLSAPAPSARACLTLGVVAHVDAGKTSLTERLLWEAGAVDTLGSVDAGTTRTDSMDLERRRGITIRASVTSFTLAQADEDDRGPVDVTVVDTPGHPDFVAEVERSLAVLDAAVLVLSSVEGVQPQTVVLWRALQHMRVPTVLFVNKVDRRGSDVEAVTRAVGRRLGASIVPLAHVAGEGTPAAAVSPRTLLDDAVVAAVADADDEVLAGWVEGATLRESMVARALGQGVQDGSLTPLVCGSALTGAGLPLLRRVLATLVPPAPPPGGSTSGRVFAIDHDGPTPRAWIRLWAGQIRVRDRLGVGGSEPRRVTALAVSTPDGLLTRNAVVAGQVAVLTGLSGARIGDTVGKPPARPSPRFAPATWHALVQPVEAGRRVAMYAALTALADEDPLIDLRIDESVGEAAVSLRGEVQQEVLAAVLEERYGVATRFLPTPVPCLERVVTSGGALERLGVDGNPYLATVGLRVQAAPVGHGLEFSPGAERGHLPPAFVAATEEGVRTALRQGPYGWEVTDAVVTMTDSGYYPRQSHAHQGFSKAMSSVAADFRLVAQVVVTQAVERAGTIVCPPVDRVEVDVPEPLLGGVAALLARAGAVPLETQVRGGVARLVVHLAAASVGEVARALPDLAGGEALLTTRLSHHSPVSGRTAPPRRRRTGTWPGDRQAFFRDHPR